MVREGFLIAAVVGSADGVGVAACCANGVGAGCERNGEILWRASQAGSAAHSAIAITTIRCFTVSERREIKLPPSLAARVWLRRRAEGGS